jgi:cytochrome c5
MNQIKYLLWAGLVLACVVLGTVLLRTLASTEFVSQPSSALIDIETLDPAENMPADIEGQRLFAANCQQCHSIHKVIVGPALHEVTQRGPWGNQENIYDWVRNPEAFIKKQKTLTS